MKKEYKSLIYLSIPVILAIILTVKVNISIVNNMPYFPFRLTNLSFSIITMIITLLFFIAFIKKFKNQTWSFLKRYGKELFLLIIALALINKYVIPNLSYAFTFWQLKEFYRFSIFWLSVIILLWFWYIKDMFLKNPK